MTGLDPDHDTIMSIACFVTDAQLNLIDPDGWETRVHHDKTELDKMGQWCIQTHDKSGLTAECINSTTTAQQAADALFEYVCRFVPSPGRGLLAGSSVHCDRAFLRKQPYDRTMNHLSHRILDVSTIKEAAKRWSPREVPDGVPIKQGLHQAKEDILESIEEARYYREKLFSK